MIELAEVEKVVGTSFPGGFFRIEGYEHQLGCDAVLAPRLGDGAAHPIFAYLAGIRGMGMSLDELFDLVGSSAEEGVMFGELEVELLRPLRVGTTYQVRGEITDVRRKEGRQAGVFDIVSFRLELLEDGEAAAVSTNAYIFPRGV